MSIAKLAGLLIAVALTASCGKKGPPLVPFQRIPDAAEVKEARRIGNDVYVTIAIPSVNIDKSKPASLHHVDLYGVTALTPPSRAQFLEVATLVATVPVAREADPEDTSGTVVADPKTGALQGTAVTVRESLSPEAMAPRALPAADTPRPAAATAAPPPQALRRFYMTVPFSDRRRSGPPSAVLEVPLARLPEKVTGVQASLARGGVELRWEPAGGLLGWILERSLPPDTGPGGQAVSAPGSPAKPAAAPATGPTLYNVYRELAADPLVPPDAAQDALPWATPVPAPINASPLALLTFKEEVPLDERTRCYFVRPVRGSGATRVEGDGSERACVLPADVDPPAAPTNLIAIVVDGAINLNWDPNGEPDLGGYIVLRREAGDDTLHQLTPRPIRGTRFVDSTAVSGRTYTYVLRATDNRIPLPNVSEPAEVTETVR